MKLLLLLLLLAFSGSVLAANTPCSGKKGGVSYCKEGKFVCKDGSISRSKKVCHLKNIKSTEDISTNLGTKHSE